MRMVRPKWFAKKARWEFHKADLTEQTLELRNPIRGWYRIFPFYAHETPDFGNIEWCASDTGTIALVIINIGEFKDTAITQNALNNIRAILTFFKEKNYDIILRITYDHVGKALEREPFFFSTVLEHLKQVIPVMNEFSDIIFVYQGMLIGNWGEMHTSKFVSAQKLKEIWSVLKQEVNDNIFFAVRKPSFWRLLHPEFCDKESLAADNMGLFDDAIFGSSTHLGTFGSVDRYSTGWDTLWSRQCELDFEDQLCQHVPNGGEALGGEEFLIDKNMVKTIEILRKMHITYLNRDYDELILNQWKEWKWESSDVWQGMNFFDYIGRHMGYRFCVRDVEVTPSEVFDENIVLTIQIENVGFANIYQEAALYIEWTDSTGKELKKELLYDMRKWNSGSVQFLTCGMKHSNSRFYLSARRKKDGRRIYFANKADNDGRVFLGEIDSI